MACPDHLERRLDKSTFHVAAAQQVEQQGGVGAETSNDEPCRTEISLGTSYICIDLYVEPFATSTRLPILDLRKQCQRVPRHAQSLCRHISFDMRYAYSAQVCVRSQFLLHA